MTSTPPTTFCALPSRVFPFTMRAYPVDSTECIWMTVVEEPSAVFVPPLAGTHGPVRMVIECADGTIIDSELASKSPTVQDREPNFRGADGRLYLVRCFSCAPNGRENWVFAVASGQCCWCGWSEEGRQP